jgi:UDP-N-acetylmuramoyl-tripeptide--D-alanyl-D-alanine ligase
MKNSIYHFLASIVRKILAKYQPKIIGITGSVGKTSAKEAIFYVVAQHLRARKSEKNFNNQLGLPLTIIGSDAPGRNVIKWIGIILKAVCLLLLPQRYPEVLVLEMGIDRTGDMDHLLSIAHPDIAVITNIGISHYEFFKDVAAIEQEKGKLAEAVTEQDILLVNVDNDTAYRQKNKAKGRVWSYGVQKGQADITLRIIKESLLEKVGTTFLVQTPQRQIEVTVNAVGQVHLSALACAAAIGEILKMDAESIAKGLQQYKPAPGRLNIIAGIKHSTIIDDTYNAAPDSMNEALAVLQRMPQSSKMAVLGDMLELGALSDEAHRRVGAMVAAMQLDHLITVGPSGRIIADSAVASGMSEDKVLSFDNSDEARHTVQELLRPNSAVLIKGSQGIRMEKITKEIMAEPMRAPELLCRQYGKWLES